MKSISALNKPLLSNALNVSILFFLQIRKSSIPCAGAVWTHPVPASVVTWSAWRSVDFLSRNGWKNSIFLRFLPLVVETFTASTPHLSIHDSNIKSAIT